MLQTPIPSPTTWLEVLSAPPEPGHRERPASAADDPVEWARHEQHRCVFKPLLRTTRPQALDKKIARLLPLFRRIMRVVFDAVQQGLRPQPTSDQVLRVGASRAERLAATEKSWGARSAALLGKAGEIHAVSLDMLVRAANASRDGVIQTSLEQRTVFLDAADRVELLLLLVDAAPEYAKREDSSFRLPSALADRLAFLTWEAAMRYHAQVMSLVPENIRSGALASLELPESDLQRRIESVLTRLPPQKARDYRRFLDSRRPTEEEVDEIVREACSTVQR